MDVNDCVWVGLARLYIIGTCSCILSVHYVPRFDQHALLHIQQLQLSLLTPLVSLSGFLLTHPTSILSHTSDISNSNQLDACSPAAGWLGPTLSQHSHPAQAGMYCGIGTS